MTEEARNLVELLRDEDNCNVLDYIDDAANLIESLSAQLDQVTRERDGLQMELDELKEEYYTDIHTARDPMADKVKQLERERDEAWNIVKSLSNQAEAMSKVIKKMKRKLDAEVEG